MKFKLFFLLVVISCAFFTIYFINSMNDELFQNNTILSFFPNVTHIIPIIIVENNFFDNYNLSITTKIFESGPQAIEAFFANSIDIAYIGPGPVINGFLKSEQHNLRILSGSTSGGMSFIAHPDSQLFSINDLSGKKIAVPQIGNTQDISLRYYLSENELYTIEKGGDVYIFNISNPDIYTLFTKGEIDAAWISEPWATILVKELGGNRLFYEEDLWPENKFATVLLVSRYDYLQENISSIWNILDLHRDTISWIHQNQNHTTLLFNQFLNNLMGQSLTNNIVDTSLSHMNITDDPISNSIYVFAERAYSLGYLGRHGYDLNNLFYSEIQSLYDGN